MFVNTCTSGFKWGCGSPKKVVGQGHGAPDHSPQFHQYINPPPMFSTVQLNFLTKLDMTGSCSSTEFQCANRDCISGENTVCNFVNDCGDGSDEAGCGKL